MIQIRKNYLLNENYRDILYDNGIINYEIFIKRCKEFKKKIQEDKLPNKLKNDRSKFELINYLFIKYSDYHDFSEASHPNLNERREELREAISNKIAEDDYSMLIKLWEEFFGNKF